MNKLGFTAAAVALLSSGFRPNEARAAPRFGPPVAAHAGLKSSSGNLYHFRPTFALNDRDGVVLWSVTESSSNTQRDFYGAASTLEYPCWGTRHAFGPNRPGEDSIFFSRAVGLGSGGWGLVWGGRGPTEPYNRDIFSSVSSDTWNWNPAKVISGDSDSVFVGPNDSKAAANGTWLAALSNLGARIARTEGADGAWGPATDIARGRGAAETRLATDGEGNWVAIWLEIFGRPDPSFIAVLTAFSSDDGLTWNSPAELMPLNQSGVLEYPGSPAIAAGPDGVFIVLATDDSTRQVVSMRSADNGITWSRPEARAVQGVVNGSPSGSVMPEIATDDQGNWLAAWITTPCPARDPWECNAPNELWGAASSDNGLTWTPPYSLLPDVFQRNAARTHVETASLGAGQWALIWPEFGPVPGPREGQTASVKYALATPDSSSPPSNDAAIVPFPLPVPLETGRTYQAEITVRNTGSLAWCACNESGYKLAFLDSTEASWGIQGSRINLPFGVSIAPGVSWAFPVGFRAPARPGAYLLRTRMVSEFVEFFGETLEMTIVVEPGPNTALFWESYE